MTRLTVARKDTEGRLFWESLVETAGFCFGGDGPLLGCSLRKQSTKACRAHKKCVLTPITFYYELRLIALLSTHSPHRPRVVALADMDAFVDPPKCVATLLVKPGNCMNWCRRVSSVDFIAMPFVLKCRFWLELVGSALLTPPVHGQNA